MTTLVWDAADERTYQNGIDRCVLYKPDRYGVVWNGVTDVTEKFTRAFSPAYFDGQKVGNTINVGDYSATLTAITYPEEFTDIEGDYELRSGIYMTSQQPKTFFLSYRTLIGDALVGNDYGYKLHLVYNITAIPSDKTFTTLSDSPETTKFSWELSAIPPDALGFRPTAHVIIDSTKVDDYFLASLEDRLYGSVFGAARIPTFDELIDMINVSFRIKITDNGDGTWTAEDHLGDYIHMTSSTSFEITDANAIYLTGDMYEISDSYDAPEGP